MPQNAGNALLEAQILKVSRGVCTRTPLEGRAYTFILDSLGVKICDMCRGDVKLHKMASALEYLDLNKRQTETRTGSDQSSVRAVPQKMFATDDLKEILWQFTFFC